MRFPEWLVQHEWGEALVNPEVPQSILRALLGLIVAIHATFVAAPVDEAPPELLEPKTVAEVSAPDDSVKTQEVPQPQAHETPAPQADAPESEPAPEPAPVGCTLTVSTDVALQDTARQALAAIAPALDEISLTLVDSGGMVTVSFGGEWTGPVPQLGWTAPDRRTILINPDHPLIHQPPAMVDVIAHEMGHVLIGPDHVHDGTLLDPHLDGVVRLGEEDLRHLDALTCDSLGF